MTSKGACLSLRIDLGEGRFGPGKAKLLEAIDEAGSISGAARALGMSYARAWTLTEEMNGLFAAPLVETFAGGARRGGARLTETGKSVSALYAEVCRQAEQGGAAALRGFTALAKR